MQDTPTFSDVALALDADQRSALQHRLARVAGQLHALERQHDQAVCVDEYTALVQQARAAFKAMARYRSALCVALLQASATDPALDAAQRSALLQHWLERFE